jgi:GGDEF domain-containing protein
MDPVPLRSIARVAERPFQSFSEAAGRVLDALAPHLDGAAVAVTQLDWDRGEWRVVDARDRAGIGLEAGLSAPLTGTPCGEMAAGGGPRVAADAGIEPAFEHLDLVRTLGIRSYAGVPLELSDGLRVGTLAVFSPEPGRFGQPDLDALEVLGRMLASEYERVRRVLELRRLRGRLDDHPGADPVTGAPGRESLLAALEHEWEVSRAGATVSYLVAMRVAELDAARERYGGAMADLLLRDAARAVSANIRQTDLYARVDDETFGVLLVGCGGPDGAGAFVRRVREGLEVLTAERPLHPELLVSMQDLAAVGSAGEVLEAATAGIAVPAREIA